MVIVLLHTATGSVTVATGSQHPDNLYVLYYILTAICPRPDLRLLGGQENPGVIHVSLKNNSMFVRHKVDHWCEQNKTRHIWAVDVSQYYYVIAHRRARRETSPGSDVLNLHYLLTLMLWCDTTRWPWCDVTLPGDPDVMLHYPVTLMWCDITRWP